MILIYHTGDNHSGPSVLGAGGVVCMYYSNLAISVLVVCTYGAIMSQPMTYWRGALPGQQHYYSPRYIDLKITLHSVVFCDYVHLVWCY